MSPLKIGDRVVLTRAGRRLYWERERKDRLGVLDGWSKRLRSGPRRRPHPRVRWDGNVTATSYHPSFIRKATTRETRVPPVARK